MGFNTTVVVLNDALGHIEKDPEFGKKLVQAIMQLSDKPDNVPAGNFVNACQVVEQHHASVNAVVVVGANRGGFHTEPNQELIHHTDDGKIEILKRIAQHYGFTLVQQNKPKPNLSNHIDQLIALAIKKDENLIKLVEQCDGEFKKWQTTLALMYHMC